VHERTGLQIELHWRLFLNPHAMTETLIMEASRVVPLTESEGLRTLGEEDLFAYLCMHGALHWWYRLKWLADINAILAARPPEGVERLVRDADVRRAGRAAGPSALPAASEDAPPRPTSDDAGKRRDGTLAGGNGVERHHRCHDPHSDATQTMVTRIPRCHGKACNPWTARAIAGQATQMAPNSLGSGPPLKASTGSRRRED
jgi:hypothetical protein